MSQKNDVVKRIDQNLVAKLLCFEIKISYICDREIVSTIIFQNNPPDRATFSFDLIIDNFKFIAALEG